uniref:Uncharacterized protein n=1 Tax=Pipistrellus kuhlii TaxID=59472 RepID=A0A7J7ZJJ4_PIPKU|nr:hypothetical protein mPipKuh1_009535 [Pipistrellus kuhlii]
MHSPLHPGGTAGRLRLHHGDAHPEGPGHLCEEQSTHEIHEKVLNKAVGTMMYHTITFTWSGGEVQGPEGGRVDNERLRQGRHHGGQRAGDGPVQHSVSFHGGISWLHPLPQHQPLPEEHVAVPAWEQAVTIEAKAFGFSVIFYDPYLQDSIERSLGVQKVYTLQDLLYQSN